MEQTLWAKMKITECNDEYRFDIWNELKLILSTFLPTLLDDSTKPKVFDQIRSDYVRDNVWERQNEVILIMKDIEVTLMLGRNMGNEVAQKELTIGYSKLFKELERVDKLWNKWRNKIPNTPKLLDNFNGWIVECKEYDTIELK